MADESPISLSGGPPETQLALAPAAARERLQAALEVGRDQRRAAVAEVAAAFPRYLDAWASLGDLARDASGQAKMAVTGKRQKVEVVFGTKYTALVIFSPKGGGRSFVCFEPMTGITDAMNLAHKGLYKDLQTIPPHQTWQETFWIKPLGF